MTRLNSRVAFQLDLLKISQNILERVKLLILQDWFKIWRHLIRNLKANPKMQRSIKITKVPWSNLRKLCRRSSWRPICMRLAEERSLGKRDVRPVNERSPTSSDSQFMKWIGLVQGTYITVQEHRPFILAHVHLRGMWLRPMCYPTYRRTTIGARVTNKCYIQNT